MKDFISKHTNIVILFIAFILISLYSACSPLYPLNPWDDPQVFMTMGKSVLSGKLMYHDLYDQKGPVLFFLHMWAAFISSKSFIGIYLLEIACMFGFLLYGYKIMRLFTANPISLPLMCLLGLFTVTSDFYYYGDSVEEFCLPILAHAQWLMLRYIKEGKFPSTLQSVLLGIGAGLIFWTKFNIAVFFYGGALIALLIITFRNRQLLDLGKAVAWITTGFIGVATAVLLYFVLHGTVTDLFQCYFYNNIFLYGGKMANGEPDVWWFILVKLSLWIILSLPVFFTKVRKDVKLFVFMTYSVIVLSFALMTVQLYYFVLCFAFFPLLIYFFRNVRLGKKSVSVMILCAVWQTIFNWNIVTLVMGTFPTKTLEMAEIVDRNKTDDSKILTYCSYDTGIYVYSDKLPPNRHFFLPNVLSTDIKQELADCVHSGDIKYLVRWTGYVKTTHDYYYMPIPKNYRLIYDKTENYRYRFITSPILYTWNLVWPRPIMSLFIHPKAEPQHMMMYERIY